MQPTKKHLPESFRSYFWDVDFEKLEVEKQKFFIIKRVLDRGNTIAIRWLINTYGKEEIAQVIMQTKDISRPTANFWADMLELDKTKVPCLQKPYSRIHFGLFS